MDAERLRDRVAKGMGVAARKTGRLFKVFRPTAVGDPLDVHHRILDLNATFVAAGSSGDPAIWHGVFDSSYTVPGDILVGGQMTFFIGSQLPGAPVQCVLTNRRVSVVRPMAAQQTGYSGIFATSAEALLAGWPARFKAVGDAGDTGKAGHSRLGGWMVSLPALPVAPQVDDLITDDLGGAYLVGSAEQNVLGWRLLVRQTGA